MDPLPSSSVSSSPKAVQSSPLTAKARGTQSRPKPYLLDKLESRFVFAQLPKTRSILCVFFSNIEKNMDPSAAAQDTFNKHKRKSGKITLG